jgi:hypothetical protein
MIAMRLNTDNKRSHRPAFRAGALLRPRRSSLLRNHFITHDSSDIEHTGSHEATNVLRGSAGEIPDVSRADACHIAAIIHNPL